MAHALFTDVLEAGDRLEDAIQTGDFDAAALALDDRKRALHALSTSGLGRPPEAITERARAQADRLALTFHARLQSLGQSISTTVRTAHAGDQYQRSAMSPAILDTAPR